MKNIISYLLAFIIFLFGIQIDLTAKAVSEFPEFSYNEYISYSDYLDSHKEEERPESEIILKPLNTKSFEGKNAAVIKDDSEKDINFNLNINQEGLYCIEISYYPISSSSPTIEFSLKIDNKIPYNTASHLNLNKIWINEKDITKDSKGNQIRPVQIQQGIWCKSFLNDTEGLFSEPLLFFFEKGRHKISLDFERAGIALESIKLCQPENLISYQEYSEKYLKFSDKKTAEENKILIEGENALYKTSAVLYPTYDNSGCNVSPSDPGHIIYNTIGDENWNKPLQSITWLIPHEEIKSGFYKIGIKARQDELRGFCSSRRIYIDGKIPFEEFNNIKFYYNSEWSLTCPAETIYLDSEKDHFITIEAVAGEISEYLCRLDNIISEINKYYKDIIMITGTQPDKYTDYYVHEKLPNLLDDFKKFSDELKDIKKGIEDISDSYGSEASAITGMTVILDKCIKKPLKIPQYLSEIYDNISYLSVWGKNCINQPLEIDYIELCTENTEFSDIDEKFNDSLSFGFKSFIGSFFNDYSEISDIEGDNAIEVWINSGREQAQIIRELTESKFMAEYPDIPVSINLVSSGFTEASLSGNQPDAALFLEGEFPVNLAARGLLVNLKEFDDYSEIKKRFHDKACVNYEYNNGCYGLPISQSWAMMFYRKDILNQLGFNSVPETWQELINMLPAIQRNYMSVGLVLPSNNILPSTETGHTFACLMLQNGLNYYKSNLSESTFDSPEAAAAFEQWTDFYTKYGFMQSYDSFSRFRTGEYPIIISDYKFFNRLEAFAPEIKGLWGFAPVPGTLNKNNNKISHAVNSNGTCGVIFNKNKNCKKEKAWEFLKWFTSEEIQTEYARRTEGIMGISGRFDTANTEALKNLSWSADELRILFMQREQLEEIPITPSSYAVTRNIMNAFRETVNKGKNPRDTFIWYNRDINQEIKRKIKNMGK